jgi:hypothetical protein
MDHHHRYFIGARSPPEKKISSSHLKYFLSPQKKNFHFWEFCYFKKKGVVSPVSVQKTDHLEKYGRHRRKKKKINFPIAIKTNNIVPPILQLIYSSSLPFV